MSAYMITHARIHDPQEFKKYVKGFMADIESFPGKILVVKDNPEVIEGESLRNVRTVVMEFPSMDVAKEWYKSERYQKIIGIRHRSAETDMIFVEGLSQ